METIILTLTRKQWDTIEQGLNELPRKFSQPLIEACIGQINEQVLAEQMLTRENSP